MSTKREAAQKAARLGFDVIPITPNAKKPPLIADWPNHGTRDPTQIDAWWDQYPDANIGGVMNDKLVFDIDKRHKGWDTWAFLKLVEEFPKTLCSTTAGGGAHVIYQMPEGQHVTNGTHKAGQGVDIKGFGGYIVLPGSTIDGRKYEWDNNTPMAQAPVWAVDRYRQTKKRTDVAGKRIVEEDEIAIEQATRWIKERAPRAELGAIDDTTFAVAAQLYDFGCSEETVLGLMFEWNETHCDGLGDLERLPVVVHSAIVNRDKPIGCSHPLAPGFEATQIDESAKPADLDSVAIDTTTPGKRAAPTDGMHLEGYFEASDKALSSQAEPLIKGVLDRGAMSILYGESNTGKTFVSVDLAFHIAAGLAWAGRKTRNGAVVYVAAEGGVGVYKRLAALRKHYPDVGDVPLFIIKFPVDLLHGAEHGKALVKLCQDAASRAGLPLELIVIDTLSRAMSGGDENSSTDMGAMVKSFDALREVTGAHLQVIHHSGKDRAKGARGHSLLRAATDTEIEIERGRITVTKQRDMDGEFKHAFRLTNVTIGRDADGADVTSCVVTLVAAAGPVVVPPTAAEETLIKQIEFRLERLEETSFGADFIREIYLELAWSAGSSDGAIYKVLQTLQSKGMVKKVKPGQYVMADTPKLQTLQT